LKVKYAVTLTVGIRMIVLALIGSTARCGLFLHVCLLITSVCPAQNSWTDREAICG